MGTFIYPQNSPVRTVKVERDFLVGGGVKPGPPRSLPEEEEERKISVGSLLMVTPPRPTLLGRESQFLLLFFPEGSSGLGTAPHQISCVPWNWRHLEQGALGAERLGGGSLASCHSVYVGWASRLI